MAESKSIKAVQRQVIRSRVDIRGHTRMRGIRGNLHSLVPDLQQGACFFPCPKNLRLNSQRVFA